MAHEFVYTMNDLRKVIGDRTILDGITLSFFPGAKIGVLGANGSGKSTLLGMMTGNLEPDAGKVVIGETVRFGHFTQEPTAFDPEMKVIEAVHEIAEYM